MANKVKSIPDYMLEHRKDVAKKAKEMQRQLMDRLDQAKDPQIPDTWQQIVKDKIERDGLSYSSLKRFKTSPYDYVKYLLQAIEDEDQEQTESIRTGNLVDCLVTEPDKFDQKYFLMPSDVSRRSNEGKAIYELYMELAEGKQVISQEELDQAYDIVEALYMNQDARYYLDRIYNPQKFFSFVHARTGIKIRGAFDWEGPHLNPKDPREGPEWICDMKTAADGSGDGFPKKTWGLPLWYRGQVGVYCLYYKSKWQFPDFYHLVVENKRPHNVNVFRVTDELKKEAIQEVEDLLTAFKMCLENNLWHKSYDFLRLGGPRYVVENPPRFSRYNPLDD